MFLVYPTPWALETNFAGSGNPWNGQPCKVAPVGDVFIPNTKPPAENLNQLLNANYNTILTLQRMLLTSSMATWTPEASPVSSSIQLACRWDPKTNRFLLLTENTSTLVVSLFATYGQDAGTPGGYLTIPLSFTPANSLNYGSVCTDPLTAGSYCLTYSNSVGTHNSAVFQYWNGSTLTQEISVTAAGYFYGVEVASLNVGGTGYVFFAVAGTGTTDSAILVNTVPSFPSWGIGVSPNVALAVDATWCLKSNGSQVVGIPSSINLFTVYSTTNGTSWTTSSSLSSLVPAGYTVVGLTWTQDALGLCWLACACNGSAPPLFYRSIDGVTWTAQLGGMTTTVTVVDMDASGPLVVATLKDGSTGGPSGAIMSPDGGISWYASQHTFAANTGSPPTPNSTRARVASSQIGFMTMNGLYLRFSGLGGLPPTAL
jgi:hypothetical protein